MQTSHTFLFDLAVVLGVAAVSSVLFQRLRQPPVLGYLLAGFIVGPHVFVPLVTDPETIRTLAELGVILLMFSLGLDFKFHRLARLGPTAGVVGAVEIGLMMTLGYAAGQVLGWSQLESIFAAGIVAISSTVIIIKVLQERRVERALEDLVFGVLIVEDLVAIVLIAALTAVAGGMGLSAGALAQTGLRLGLFLMALAAAGILVVPWLMRIILRLRSPETTLVASVGLCFAAALLASSAGYSVALGAFLAGSLVAESGASRQVEELVRPVRDMFAAIFFVAIGMLIDPRILAVQWRAVVLLSLVVIGGKAFGVSVGGFLTGHGIRTSVRAGLSMTQIGEFSFIIAGVGLAGGVTPVGDFLLPVAVAVSVITAFTTPWLVALSGPLANLIDRRLPRPLQTFGTLYGSWLEELRSGPRAQTLGRRARRYVGILLIDAVALAGIVIGGSLAGPRALAALGSVTGFSGGLLGWLGLGLAALVAFPFLLGLLRTARALGLALAEAVLPPPPEGKVDPGLAPRRALTLTIQMGAALMVGVPLMAVTVPFVPGYRGAAVLALAAVLFLIAVWRSAANLQGHVRAGAQIIVEVLSRQGADAQSAAFEQVRHLLPGIGELTPVAVGTRSAAVGKTLADLNLRGSTGASVVALCRGEERIVLPTARDVLRAGDLLALTGTSGAIAAARQLLEGRPVPAEES